MADGHERSSEEREAARREREARRAARSGRRPLYEEAAAAFADEPPELAVEPPPALEPPPAVEPPPAIDQPPVVEPSPPPVDPGPDPNPDPDPDPDPDPPALITERDPAPAPHEDRDPDALVTERDDPRRPIRSFPSPPDPEFYAGDDELEAPSGTRRVSRASRPGSGGRGGPRPPRRGPGRANRSPGAPKRRHWVGRIVALIALLIAAAIIYLAIQVFQPFGTSPHGRVTVTIAPRTGSKAVATQLHSRGVIASSFFFELRATLDGDRGKIRAGTYHLRESMSYGSVLATLTAVPKAAKTSQLTIAEGHTRQHVAQLLRSQKVTGDYLAATRRSSLLDPRHYGAPRSTDTLEGFLFPDTFTLVDPVKVSALVRDQLLDFKRRFATVDLGYAHRHHLSDFDVITIASMIEAEAASAKDRPLVASVIYNRLRDHMMLQLDSTARYATGNFTRPLTVSQLSSRSPYNTHTHFGLPPAPIDSPGLAAINAAAHPSSSRYLYFFSKPCTTRTVFATSYAEFQNLLIRDKRTHCG